ncbi:cell wall-binding repeat-containing protein [Metabacillus litoralis]|uniref:cell wall-binding repeat-containing protein n=1 Tax=Metabacillus litoralis TaxID=152268 RepID=UPI0020406130|nr:cell wall-binding repeat-containing protein [Metabacillus litoralis]MCM3654315.1 cell wall-binding repeat-containing protein [Metabacillus litoralis]
MKKLFKIGTLAVLTGSLLFSSVQETEAAGSYTRVSGSDRLSTAIEISKKGWPSGLVGEKVVILARADNPADALSAASLSGAKDAPILLTYSNTISNKVLDEIKRLNTVKVYVLGGEKAINNNVVNTLKSKGLEVVRISGSERYQTAFNINKEAGTDSNTKAIVASGTSVADALSASTDSAINGVPIYLVTKDTIPVNLPSNIKSVDIYGGLGVVSKKVEDSLKSKGIYIKRYAGTDRYDTNRLALANFKPNNSILVRGTSVTNGKEDYPDSVSASGLAHRKNAAIVLSHNTNYIPNVRNLANKLGVNSVFVLGGNSAISNSLVTAYQSSYPDPIGKLKITSLDLEKDKVVIKNEDSRDLNLTGWRLYSADGNQTFNFPDNYVLKKGSSVTIVSGRGATNNPPSQLFWTGAYMWENDGDIAQVYNPLNGIVSEVKK